VCWCLRQQRMTGIVVELHDRKPSVKTKNVLSGSIDHPCSTTNYSPGPLDCITIWLRWVKFPHHVALSAEFKRTITYRITMGASRPCIGRIVGILCAFAAHAGGTTD